MSLERELRRGRARGLRGTEMARLSTEPVSDLGRRDGEIDGCQEEG